MPDRIRIRRQQDATILRVERPNRRTRLRVRTTSTGGTDGTGLPAGGATGQILAKTSGADGAYGFISRNAADGYVGLDGSNLILESLIPASLARISDVATAIAAAGNITAVIHTSFPVSAFGGTISGGEASIPAFAAGVPVGGYIWIEDQVDDDDDGFYQHDGDGVFVQLVPGFVDLAYAGRLIVTTIGIGVTPGVWGIHFNGATPFIQRESMTTAEVQALIDAGDFASASSVTAIEARLPVLVDSYDDGSDDTAMIEAAIAANPGGRLVFQPRTYTTRRPLSLPDHTTLAGVGQDLTVIQKIAGLEMAVVSGATGGSTEIVVAAAAGLNVGDALTVSSDVHHEWDSSSVVVTAIAGDTITFTPGLEMDYSGEVGLRACRSFPVVQNVGANTSNGTHAAVTGLWVHDLTIDQNFDPLTDINDNSGRLDFTCSAIHWDKVRHSLVERVTIRNAVSDAYSDQARADTMADQGVGNTIRDCVIESPARHGIHLGTYMWDAKVLDNTVLDAGNPDRLDDVSTNVGSGLFYCAEVVGTIAMGNRFVNCWGGFFGGDVNPGRISGDVFNQIIGNQITGQIAGSTMRAIEPGGRAIVSNNVVRDWWGKGIVLGQNCDRSIIEGNHVEMIGYEAAFQATNAEQFDLSDNIFAGVGNGQGISLDTCADVTITGGRVVGFEFGVTLVNCQRVSSTMPATSAAAAYRFVSPPSTDIRIDLTTTDPALTPTLVDESTLGLVTRLVVNGLGDNGDDDPAVAGPWFDVTDPVTVLHQRRWPVHNTVVHWTDGGEHRISRFAKLPGDVPGVWIAQTPGGSDDATEVLLHAVTLATAQAALSFDVTGWAKVRIEFSGRSNRTATASDSLRATLNHDTSNVYSTNAAAMTSAFALGGVPSEQTNSNRRGVGSWVIDLTSGDWKAGHGSVHGFTSTATAAGAAASLPVALLSSITAAITSIQLFVANGSIAAGSRIRIVGLERA